MSEKKFRKLKIMPVDADLEGLGGELSDAELGMIAGGISEEIYLDEENLPLGWYVTCCRCTFGFPVSEGCCPSCGGVEVWHGTDRAIAIYDPRKPG